MYFFTFSNFLGFKIMGAQSLDLVQYTDNSHHRFKGPTFEKNLFVWTPCQQKWQRRLLEDQDVARYNFACV